VPNSELVIDISADTVTNTPFSYEIPFKFDNKEHEIKVSFYDNMTSKNELCDWVGSSFYAFREYNDFTYDFISDTNVRITGYAGYQNEISIPYKIADGIVTEIAGSAFSGQNGLSVITIPETIRFIAVGAFEDCTNLARVNYWGTEEDWANIIIGSKNENLTNSEIIYDYVPPMYVNWNYEYDGENLDVHMWIDDCFMDCLAKIELFNISRNETTIVYYDIDKGTSGEKNISIPLSNYDETFRIYGSIVSADKAEYITAPYNFAFFTPYEDKESFKEGEFEYFVNSEDEAEIARYCGESSEVVIPDTLGGYPVTKLMGWSLSGVEMTDLTIGKYLKEIGYGALSYCFALENITVNSENDNFLFEDGVLYNADKTEILLYLLTNTAEHFDMPDTVTVVGAHAFEGGEKLKSITVSENLKKLERQAFAYSVLSGELILPEGVEEIGSEALVCGFTKIHIPSTVTSMAKDAVMGGKDLLEITVAGENENFSSVDGVLYNKDKTILIEYPEAKDSVSFEIPNTVKEIGEAAFIGAENLKKVVIPKSIKLINEGAFYYTPVEEFIYRGTENEFKKVVVAGSSGVYDVSFGAPKIEMVAYSTSEASFEVTGTSEPADIVIAYYKNGIFEKVEKREFVADKVETITLNSTFDYEKDTIKIMVWDSISTQKPICEAVTIGK